LREAISSVNGSSVNGWDGALIFGISNDRTPQTPVLAAHGRRLPLRDRTRLRYRCAPNAIF